MSIRSYRGTVPSLGARVYVDAAAVVIGRVTLGDDVSVWPKAVLRGDVQEIEVGARTNVQDAAVLHVTHTAPGQPGGYALSIGADVTIGHAALLHGCRIGSRCLIGMGAIVLDGAFIEDEVLVAAGTLVPPRARLERRTLWLGHPARRVRSLTAAEIDGFTHSAAHYALIKDHYRAEHGARPASP